MREKSSEFTFLAVLKFGPHPELVLNSHYWANLASSPSLPRFYLPFAFIIIHRSGRPVKNRFNFSPIFQFRVLLWTQSEDQNGGGLGPRLGPTSGLFTSCGLTELFLGQWFCATKTRCLISVNVTVSYVQAKNYTHTTLSGFAAISIPHVSWIRRCRTSSIHWRVFNNGIRVCYRQMSQSESANSTSIYNWIDWVSDTSPPSTETDKSSTFLHCYVFFLLTALCALMRELWVCIPSNWKVEITFLLCQEIFLLLPNWWVG